MTIFDQRGQNVNVQHNSSVKPVDFLTLIGQPDNLKVTKTNIRTLLDTVYPHYISSFDEWWEDGDADNMTGFLFSEPLDDEDSAYPGELVYEYILSSFGTFVFGNS